MRRLRRLPILLAPMALLLALNLVACGNKGPLVRASADDVEDVDADEEAVDDATTVDPATVDPTTVDPATDPDAASDDTSGEVPPVDEGDDDAGTPPSPPDAGNG